jgi:hypothetical protein
MKYRSSFTYHFAARRCTFMSDAESKRDEAAINHIVNVRKSGHDEDFFMRVYFVCAHQKT